MLFEFLASLFIAKPETMHPYLMGDGSKRESAVVPLQEILDAGDLKEVRASLAVRAAKNANNGSITKVTSRIASITKRPFPKDVSAPIVEIFNLRNQIVHDGRQLTRDIVNVKATYDSVRDFLTELGKQCQNFEIPYSDPAFLIDEYPSIDESLGNNELE